MPSPLLTHHTTHTRRPSNHSAATARAKRNKSQPTTRLPSPPKL
uniref:Uncharacterized protein n=1 Tax=Arundo donax TaxID=35708 RepID=A0A0A9FR99_ARUDO